MKKLPLFSALFFTALSLPCFATSGGDNVQAARNNPIQIPFSEKGSICGAANDVDNVESNGISPIYLSGNDWVYYFVAPEAGEMNITLTNMFPIQPNSLLSIWADDIQYGRCVGSATIVHYASSGFMVNTVKGKGYYILVDNWPSPDCFDFTLTAKYILPNVLMAPCTNVDFETGTFAGWTGTGLDPCGAFPVVSPTGSFSVMMGNGQISGNGAGQMEQTFTVSTSNSV